MLPQEAIAEYKELYRKRFGVVLSDAEAAFRATNLFTLYKAVLDVDTSGSKSIADKPNSNF
jgi:hypothetical protein